jgi:hypothetical protein
VARAVLLAALRALLQANRGLARLLQANQPKVEGGVGGGGGGGCQRVGVALAPYEAALELTAQLCRTTALRL